MKSSSSTCFVLLLCCSTEAWVAPPISQRAARAKLLMPLDLAPASPTAAATSIEEVVVQTMLQQQTDLHNFNNVAVSAPKESQQKPETTTPKRTTKPWLQRVLERAVSRGAAPSLQVTATKQRQQESDAPKATTTPEVVWHASAPLATEGAWTSYLDVTDTGLVYYFNHETGQSLWKPPTDSFPAVKLPPKLHCIAREKKRDCLSARLDEMAAKYGEDAHEIIHPEVVAAVEEEQEEVMEDDMDNDHDESFFDMMSIYGGGTTTTASAASTTSSKSTPTAEKKEKTTTASSDILASHGDWDAYWDLDTGYAYYSNRQTGAVQWERPHEFPLVNEKDGTTTIMAVATHHQQDKRLVSYGDWTAYLDGVTGRIYYVNAQTSATQWNKPMDFHVVGAGKNSAMLSRINRMMEKQQLQSL